MQRKLRSWSEDEYENKVGIHEFNLLDHEIKKIKKQRSYRKTSQKKNNSSEKYF